MQLKEQTAWEELISFCPIAVSQSGHRAMIPTTKGQMIADVGDWIVRDVKGEFYPCKPAVFETTYEPVGVDVEQTDEVELQRDGLALVLKKVASLLTTTKESPQWTRVDFDYMVQNIRAVLATSDFRTIGHQIRTEGGRAALKCRDECGQCKSLGYFCQRNSTEVNDWGVKDCPECGTNTWEPKP